MCVLLSLENPSSLDKINSINHVLHQEKEKRNYSSNIEMHTSLISREQEFTGHTLILPAQVTSGNCKEPEETRKVDSIQLKVKL